MGAQSRSYLHGVPKVSTFIHHNKLTSRIVSKPLMYKRRPRTHSTLVAEAS